MVTKEAVSISVHDLLEYIQPTGDLGVNAFSPSRAVEGTKGHSAVRNAMEDILSTENAAEATYRSEVPISFEAEGKYIILNVSGRIDGILNDASGITLHEIKTTTLPLELIEHDYNPLHWAQVKCYGYMFAAQYGLDYIVLRLTYYQLDERTEKSFTDIYSIDALEEFFMPLIKECLSWQDIILGWRKVRDESISKLDFPYAEYRSGQNELIDSIYDAINKGDILFAQAPTGIGKTIAALYPSVKALGNGLVTKIFYLTARTTTRDLAAKALDDMRSKGLSTKSVMITAKEKICFYSVKDCSPDTCEYAANYYGKIKGAIADALEIDCLDRAAIEKYSRLHKVCPFELSLDLSLWCDVIICDYNYLFDPRVYLRRFFSQRGNYCFLIDEAHNLADRARDMFSSQLSKGTFFGIKRDIKSEVPDLYEAANQLYKCFLDTARKISENEGEQKNFYSVHRKKPDDIYRLLERFTNKIDSWLSRNLSVSFMEELLEIYFNCLNFMKILELYDENYVTCYDKTSRDFYIKLFCADPSKLLRSTMSKGRASILFSATLSPPDYFKNILGGGSDSRMVTLPSPFPEENLCVYIDDTISTKYRMRQLSYGRIADEILVTVNAKIGNYIVFFPSFEYLNEVYYKFMGIKAGIRTIYQTPGMTESARQQFLDEFDSFGETSLVGFAVMGGIFGEGIDLTGDRLSGAIIIGVGLPQICNERNIIRRQFDENSSSGFEYAYIYPGINRVLQAAGRVIRTENDMGVVVLIDERFSYHNYRELLPSEWNPIPRASEGYLLSDVLCDFWSRQ